MSDTDATKLSWAYSGLHESPPQSCDDFLMNGELVENVNRLETQISDVSVRLLNIFEVNNSVPSYFS